MSELTELMRKQSRCIFIAVEESVAKDIADCLHRAANKIDKLEDLVKMGEEVVEDFMPNIGKCALQDYGRLNDFLMQAAALKRETT